MALLNFSSDNTASVSPLLLEKLKATSAQMSGHVTYGEDDLSKVIEASLKRIFECDLRAFVVTTGTAANALGLASFVKPYGVIFCHEESHIIASECGAVEAACGGARLQGLPGRDGRLDPLRLEREIQRFPADDVHNQQAGAISVTQASEVGTVYDCATLHALGRIAKAHHMAFHMDGARFANGLIALGCSPADMTWKAGIDVLTFGATKNGCLVGEVVVFFNQNDDRIRDFLFRRKRAGHLLSKQWFVSAQIAAYLEDDLWLSLAKQANSMALRLADGLAKRGIGLVWPQQSNACFALVAKKNLAALRAQGLVAFEWSDFTLGADEPIDKAYAIVRLLCDFATEPDKVDTLLSWFDELNNKGELQTTQALVEHYWAKG